MKANIIASILGAVLLNVGLRPRPLWKQIATYLGVALIAISMSISLEG